MALAVGGAAVVVAAVVGGAFASSGLTGPRTIHVIEHAKTDRVIDTGAPGDTSGDLLTFHNPVFGASNEHPVGHDQGQCVRMAPKLGTWECMWTTFLAGGQITVEGPFYDTKPSSVLAVTGGTGNFSNARGSMVLRVRNGGTEFDFIFHLTA
jgi:hypothetical protein